MKKTKNKNKKTKKEWHLGGLAIFFIAVFSIFLIVITYQQAYAKRFHPGVQVAGISLGGKTMDQASELLQKKIDDFSQKGIILIYKNNPVNITPIIASSSGPDLSYKIIEFHPELTLQKAFTFGRDDTALNNLKRRVRAIYQKRDLPIDFNLNQEELLVILEDNFKQYENPAKNAQLHIIEDDVIIIEEESGKTFDYKEIAKLINIHVSVLSQAPINTSLATDRPEITKEEAEKNIGWVEEILALAPISLKYDQLEWPIEKEKLSELLELQINQDSEIFAPGKIMPAFKLDEFTSFLETIANEIDIEAQDAKFEFKNGRVTQFQASSDGLKVNIEESIKKINRSIIFEKSNLADLRVDVLPSQIGTGSVNDMGIKERLGIGTSNFGGSPANRRHNIAIGAGSLNGLLIKPEQEFSLLKALGEIDGDHGYKAELVIKGNKTIPEFGGGLCQIGTTAFRVALNAGVPITQRQNHSYRVSYYEPAGTDATIYDPAPDFRFLNDTGHNILFLARTQGDQVIFELWGTGDGRKAIQSPSPPKIYSIKAPPPTKIVETEDLPVGQKKCTERAHNGATTEFTYQVTYPSGEVKSKIFKSVYVPWQAVCLVGVEKIEDPELVEGSDEDDLATDENPEDADDDKLTNINTSIEFIDQE